ncbi:MAG: phospholipase D-like domain-containing protein [Gemmatimonadales bacterium]
MTIILVGVFLFLLVVFAVAALRDTATGKHSLIRKIASVLLKVIILALAVTGAVNILRGSGLRGGPAAEGPGESVAVSDPDFGRSIELLTGADLSDGNTVQILRNGEETYPALWADLRGAKESIALQPYFYEPGVLADTLEAILTERARAGVAVFVLADAFGAEALPVERLDALRNAGVEVASFRPLHWYNINRANTRSHVRVAAIDGKIGYTGGFGISDQWQGNGREEGQWRDTNVRFTGPAVSQLLAAFVVGWAEATGKLMTAGGKAAIVAPEASEDGVVDGSVATGPAIGPSGAVTDVADSSAMTPTLEAAGLLHTIPTLGPTAAARFYTLTIGGARERLFITNAYFVPGGYLTQLVIDAAQRGVEVIVLTAGESTDIGFTRFAAHSRFAELLAAGVRIFEYQPTMMHAKSIVADSRWASIGSMNFDNRSLTFNDESNFVALDPVFGAEVEAIFRDDLTRSKEVTAEDFANRPWWHRPMEWIAGFFAPML